MSYTDLEMKLASQVAYVNITEVMLSDYFRQHQKQPTLQELFTWDKEYRGGELYKDFIDGYESDATGIPAAQKNLPRSFGSRQ